MKIKKYENFFQEILYSKLYRSPKWLMRKLKYRRARSSNEYTVDMRIGHKICLYPTQNYLKSTLISRQYHDENIFLVKQFLSQNPVIIDIGANVGLYTCAYAQYFKNFDPTIFAIEAVDSNYNLLMKNISLNQFQNVHGLHIALGESSGFLEFNLPNSNFVGNAIGNNVAGDVATSGCQSVTKKVKLDTLDNLAVQQRIEKCDFIKVDIEGAELFLFKGATNFISKTRPVIQFEFNKFWLEKNAITLKDFSELFEPLKYTFFIEDKSHFVLINDIENYVIKQNLCDLLIIPQEKIISFLHKN